MKIKILPHLQSKYFHQHSNCTQLTKPLPSVTSFYFITLFPHPLNCWNSKVFNSSYTPWQTSNKSLHAIHPISIVIILNNFWSHKLPTAQFIINVIIRLTEPLSAQKRAGTERTPTQIPHVCNALGSSAHGIGATTVSRYAMHLTNYIHLPHSLGRFGKIIKNLK